MHDAIVVGAGPAGSTAAYLLAAQGYDVMVIERARFPRVKVCGEYLNAGAVATLRRLGVSAELRPFALDGIVMHAHDLRVRLPVSGEAWAVPRSDLDAALATQARTAGAKCVTGTAVDLHLESDSASVRFIDSSGGTVTLAARFVIGADGIGSLVARKAGLALSVPARARFAIGGHYRGFSGDGRCVEMFVDGPAYFAVNPLGGDIANVMMVVRSQTLRSMSHALDEEFAVRAEAMMRGNRHFHSIERVGKRVSIGPLAHRTRGLAKGRVLLAGDAASFIDPFTGQGVDLALRSGLRAASAVAAALRSGNPAAALAAYAREHGQDLRRRRALAAVMATLVDRPWLARRVARNLERNSGLRAALMRAISGSDEARSLGPLVLARMVA